MKTLTLLLLATLHLCCTFGMSTGAILNREISKPNNLELKDVVENGIKDIAQIPSYRVSDIRLKTGSALKDERLVESVNKDIVQYLSSFKFDEDDEKTSYPFDTPSNDSADLSCNWNRNNFKCCQSVLPIGTACIVAEILTFEIKLSYQIGTETVWKKTVPYKSNLGSMIREVFKLIAEKTDFESFNQGNIFEPSVILTEEKEEDGAETAVGDYRSTVTAKGSHCSWRGMLGQCCKNLKIKKYRLKVCFQVQVERPAYMKLQLVINGRVVWSRSAGVRSREITACMKVSGIKFCFAFYDLHISKSSVQVCLRIKVQFLRLKFNIGCIRKKFA